MPLRRDRSCSECDIPIGLLGRCRAGNAEAMWRTHLRDRICNRIRTGAFGFDSRMCATSL